MRCVVRVIYIQRVWTCVCVCACVCYYSRWEVERGERLLYCSSLTLFLFLPSTFFLDLLSSVFFLSTETHFHPRRLFVVVVVVVVIVVVVCLSFLTSFRVSKCLYLLLNLSSSLFNSSIVFLVIFSLIPLPFLWSTFFCIDCTRKVVLGFVLRQRIGWENNPKSF